MREEDLAELDGGRTCLYAGVVGMLQDLTHPEVNLGLRDALDPESASTWSRRDVRIVQVPGPGQVGAPFTLR